MELKNEFAVDVPIDRAWTVLTDIELIAPCMPGARLTEVDGDSYRGTVKVKVGPITAQYQGTAQLVERDEAAHRAVLRAEGRDTRGQGNATATITAELVASGEAATRVTLTTELSVTGKVAQFGRGVMSDVSAKLLGQFVSCLHDRVLSGDEPAADGTASPAEPAAVPAAAEDSGASAAPEPRRIDAPEVEPVDLFDAAGGALGKRLLPALAALGVLGALVALLRRRRG